MNILSTGDYLPSLTISIAQLELLIGLKKKDVNIIVVAKFNGEIKNKFEKAGIRCIEDYPNAKVDIQYINRMKQYIQENSIDIIHAFDGKALRNTIIAIKKLDVRLITYMGSTSIHWHDPSAYFTYLSPRVDKIICNSDYVYTHVKKQLFFSNKKKAVRIFKGYNPNWFKNTKGADLSYLKTDCNTTIVCLAANYLKVKGIEYYIEAIKYIPKNTNIQFLLIGDMRKQQNAIDLLINNNPLKDRIHALGFQSNPISIFKSIDIYVQTSNREGFGRAITEAMCSKKPIVMTDAGGCTELIDTDSGIIAPTKNPKEIALAILKLVNNKELRESMGNNAYDRIKNIYSINRTVKETLELYNEEYEKLKK